MFYFKIKYSKLESYCKLRSEHKHKSIIYDIFVNPRLVAPLLLQKYNKSFGTQMTVSLDFNEDYAREGRQGNFHN